MKGGVASKIMAVTNAGSLQRNDGNDMHEVPLTLAIPAFFS